MDIIDFLIGAFLANAMPHFIFGITKTKFLGMFGYSPKGNIIYALVQFIICVVLITLKYEFATILTNGLFIGGFMVLFLYFIFGKFLLDQFNK
ncbi:hypothetical protein GCM10022393_36460 [Aquimarina addita]|uniref:PQ-loop repeat-containing protein n=1 Tax=Aquimarina addita TaxID=870485 RepID=A0ABP6UV84_9FLAO